MVYRDKFASEKRNFSYNFEPIYYFVRVCGQMPFTIVANAHGIAVDAKMYQRDFIWLAISIGIHCAFIFMAVEIFQLPRHPNAATSTIHFGDLTFWLVSLLVGISILAMDACNRFKIVEILKKFTSFDEGVRGRWTNTSSSQTPIWNEELLQLFSVRTFQMARFGIYFDYASERRRAWLYCGGLISMNLLSVAMSFYHTYNYFMESHSLLNMFEFISSAMHQTHILTAPVLTYIFMLHNLRKRYGALNQLLR